ncbi:hypothetical protein GOP47_0001135 [Adiantum capillus-veneris]|uniref:non-specific serine/threonine protein kinase n=1 Tax=Adiantum capillus-veneris TaxID=13818 RepID=A0A9D4VG20_ADICA|nr:hypothetical protein GOP47_0001135 [Adiantum capillus-veneris]
MQFTHRQLRHGNGTHGFLGQSGNVLMSQVFPWSHIVPGFLCMVLIVSVSSTVLSVSTHNSCSTTDLRVLHEFYESLHSPKALSWSAHRNCCSWTGISCNSEGQVVSVHLPSLSLTGTIPPILFNLSALSSVDLSNNFFHGRIPPNIASSSSLTVLDLSYNQLLTGPLPLYLPLALCHLDVSHCAFHGMIPQSVTSLLTITELLINGNYFSSFASGNNSSMAALLMLDASDNLFTSDSLQFLMNCTKVRYLNLDRNQIEGQMPSQLGEMVGLEVLRLQENLLTGSIPQVLGNCTEMRHLWMDDNRLHGSIPETLGKLSMLMVLSLENNSLEGPFPMAITKCSLLMFLSLSGNKLSGNIPADLGTLQHLNILLLAGNQFSGSVPLVRQFLAKVKVLDLSNNKLEGSFVSSYIEDQTKPLHTFTVSSVSKHWPWRVDKFPHVIHVCRALIRKHVSHLSQKLWYTMVYPTLKLVPCFKIACLDTPGRSSSNTIQLYRHLLQSNEGGDSKKLSPVLIGVLAGIVVFFSILLIVAVVMLCRLKVRPWQRSRLRRAPAKLPSLRKFRRESSKVFDPTLASISMRDLVKATDGFNPSRVVGDGGFGLVYSATLADGRMVAVKKLCADGIQGKREFEAEMETLGRMKHPNLVELLAYCKVADERVLVYEFVQYGSLDTWLHEREDGPGQMTWNMRVKIARGSARGLSYLHHESDPHVIHRDIKSSNILLGKDFEPKIADFGLARALSPFISHVSTDAAGTLGYMAPEYAMTLCATKQADVYSFGMVMLELGTGRRPNLLIQEKNFRSLAKWSRHMLQLGYEMDVLDTVFKKVPPPSNQVQAYFAVACDCVSELPNERPTMREVYERLNLIEQSD